MCDVERGIALKTLLLQASRIVFARS